MFQIFHPEMTDITEDDIKTVTLNPVILNTQYNDLAILVRDKLIIFVEAQSTWTINILVRILLYLSATYQEYIIENNMYVYGTKKLAIPEPEFYVIYTGRRRITKEIISLREDFWNNPNAKLDMLVKIIYAESKDDVIGQYIIFCHVLDGQIKIRGRKKIAFENTIKICQDKNILREYLEGRKKEVIDIMVMLFDQDYATEAYAEEKARRRGMKNSIEVYQEMGASIEETINRFAAKFAVSAEEASKYVRRFWKKKR